MSPVFRHGRLRLYLLKLLDEAPRHGYEVIRLLQDRFLGVYAPSPGTIYPRLTRLEEEGLVTHEEVAGRKVYRITDKGRAELRARLDDLAELEAEITASVRDIAREVTEDVRETVRTLRERTNRGWGERGSWGQWDQWVDWGERHEPGERHEASGQPGRGQGGGSRPHVCADPHTYRDLERLARQFSQDLQATASQAQAVSQDAVRELRGILSEALDRIRTDVFRGTSSEEQRGNRDPGAEPGPASAPGTQPGPRPESAPPEPGANPEP